MSRLKSMLRNLRSLLTDDFSDRWQSQEARSKEHELRLSELNHNLSKRLTEHSTRADAYEAAVDKRIAERLDAFEQSLGEYQTAVDDRINQRLNVIEQRLDEYQALIDLRIDDRLAASEKAEDERFAAHEERGDERFAAHEKRGNEIFAAHEKRGDARADKFETALTSRLNGFEEGMTSRATEYESTTNQRLGAFEAALDARIEGRLTQTDKTIEKRVGEAEARLSSDSREALESIDLHFDERSRATDNRLDDRLAHIERHIDSRFNTLEQRSDHRMETHERTVDGKLHQRSQDIVDRNDLMLQLFDQQLDKFRRQLRALDAHLIAGGEATKEPVSEGEARGVGSSLTNGSPETGGTEPPQQLISFRKLAATGAQTLRKVGAGAAPLYDQILSWKKIAHEGLNQFAPNEKEIADYILTFLSDPKEVTYVQQHLRRFVATIERVPTAERPEDRLLELGSLGHLAPAVRKFCGYSEVFCADSWEGEERVRIETLRQANGPDSHSFELRNFNVESDAFPYPNGYFRTVLCCELIEHLQRDPLHMLWECNRVLADNGHLLLTTPNIASVRAIEGLLVGCTPYLLNQYNLHEVADQHNREYAPYEIGVALAAAGFSVVALETEDVWLRSNPAVIELLKEIQISSELRGDNIFALAKKVGSPIERYPAELYTER